MQLLGVESEDALIGHHVFDLVASDSLDQAQARRQAVQSGGWPRPEVLDIVTGGGPTTVEVTSTPVFWEGRLASQLTLRRVEDRWADVIRIGAELTNSITQAVILTDLNYNVVAWNDEATHLYGWTREEMLGRCLTEVAMWDATTEELGLAYRELELFGRWKGTVRQLRRDGATITVDCDSRVIHGADGIPLGMVTVNALAIQSDAEAEADARLLGRADDRDHRRPAGDRVPADRRCSAARWSRSRRSCAGSTPPAASSCPVRSSRWRSGHPSSPR